MVNERTPVVLVADDDPSMLMLVAQHARMLGFRVLEASDGDEALQLAREHLPDLIVLDVMMPGASGWDVCRRVREDVALAHTGVVMLTGMGETINAMTSPLHGADEYIDKPFEFPELDEKIRSTLAKRASLRQGAPGLAHSEPAPVKEEEGDDDGDDPPAPSSRRGSSKKRTAKRPPTKRAPRKAAKKSAQKRATKKVAAKKPAAKAARKAAGAKKVTAKPARRAAGAKKATAKPARKAAGTKKATAKPARKAAGAKKAVAKPARKAATTKKTAAKPARKAVSAKRVTAKPARKAAKKPSRKR